MLQCYWLICSQQHDNLSRSYPDEKVKGTFDMLFVLGSTQLYQLLHDSTLLRSYTPDVPAKLPTQYSNHIVSTCSGSTVMFTNIFGEYHIVNITVPPLCSLRSQLVFTVLDMSSIGLKLRYACFFGFLTHYHVIILRI